jgi:hypothetical protein
MLCQSENMTKWREAGGSLLYVNQCRFVKVLNAQKGQYKSAQSNALRKRMIQKLRPERQVVRNF